LEDQAETLLMRLTRGSGPDGLAAMSAVVETADVRVLRPLLAIPGDRLRRTLAAFGQTWIEDPSNRDSAYGRVRARQWLPALSAAGHSPPALARTAGAFGRRRRDGERRIAALLARACALYPAGYARLDAKEIVAAPPAVAAGAVARVLVAVGGVAYAPAARKLEALMGWFGRADGAPSATLSRCRCQRRGDEVVVCREGRRLPPPVPIAPGERGVWDGRFDVDARGGRGEGNRQDGVWLSALGRDGWAEIVAVEAELRDTPIPYAARLTLPALRDAEGVVAVPHLEFRRLRDPEPACFTVTIRFSPRNSLSGAGFCLAPIVSSTISVGAAGEIVPSR